MDRIVDSTVMNIFEKSLQQNDINRIFRNFDIAEIDRYTNNNGDSILHLCVYNDKASDAIVLLDKRVNAYLKNKNGETFIDTALRLKKYDFINSVLFMAKDRIMEEIPKLPSDILEVYEKNIQSFASDVTKLYDDDSLEKNEGFIPVEQKSYKITYIYTIFAIFVVCAMFFIFK